MVEVIVPDRNFRMGRLETSYWMGTGGWFSCMRRELCDEVALSIMASRLSYDLRKTIGTEETKSFFEKMAASVDQVGEMDL